MRTDSVNLAQNALDEAESFIKSTYGNEYSTGPKKYKTRSKSAQEAHEAVRPTSATNTPERVAQYLSSEQLRLYTLIWKRTIASQMADAIVDHTGVDITAAAPNGNEYTVRATGSVIKFDGFRKLYIETKDEDAEDEDSKQLPAMNEGDSPKKQSVNADQKFTQPPPRFTEANLIRFLEEQGIGRPSTYASIVGTIERRQYVDREKTRFKPTPLGTAVSDLLTEHFANIMDLGFTSSFVADATANFCRAEDSRNAEFRSRPDLANEPLVRSRKTGRLRGRLRWRSAQLCTPKQRRKRPRPSAVHAGNLLRKNQLKRPGQKPKLRLSQFSSATGGRVTRLPDASLVAQVVQL
jgi:hypothetical protein